MREVLIGLCVWLDHSNSSRITQSTIGLAMATEWMSLGCVRASIVAREAPILEPMRESFGVESEFHGEMPLLVEGKRLGMMSSRIWEKATDVSWIGCGKRSRSASAADDDVLGRAIR